MLNTQFKRENNILLSDLPKVKLYVNFVKWGIQQVSEDDQYDVMPDSIEVIISNTSTVKPLII